MFTAIVLGCLALAAAAQDPRRSGHLRVFHASPDAPAVDILVDGKKAFSSVAFGSVTPFATLPDGIYEVAVNAAGTNTTVLKQRLPVILNVAATIAAVGLLKDLRLEPMAWEPLVKEKGCGARVAHFSPDAPAVEVVADDKVTLIHELPFRAFEPPFGHVDSEAAAGKTTKVSIRAPGSSKDILSTEFSCKAGSKTTVAVIGLASGKGAQALKFFAMDDAVPANATLA